jgi:hypothetical protein
MSFTHVAAAPVNAEGRIIQRCALCGFKLLDSQGVEMHAPEGQPVPVFTTWEPGRLVKVTADAVQVMLPKAKHLPPDSCLPLVE